MGSISDGPTLGLRELFEKKSFIMWFEPLTSNLEISFLTIMPKSSASNIENMII